MSLFRALFGWLLNPADGKAAEADEAALGAPGTGPEPASVVIAIGTLDGAGGPAVSARLQGLWGRLKAVEVRRWDKVLKPVGAGNLAQRLLAAADMGREWLVAEGADLLVWGESDGKTATLRFLSAHADVEGKPGTFGLGDTLDLPAALPDNLEAILAATVLAAAAGSKEGQRYRISLLLAEAADRANPFIEIPPEGLSGSYLASAFICLGNAFGMMYRLSSDVGRLRRSTEAYMAAAARCPKDEAPLTWALGQNHLAANLEALADATKATEPLDAAAKAYQAVAETLGKGTYPHDWALAQMRLGMVLGKLAGRSAGRAKEFKEAAEAFENALKVITREAMPGRWAEIQNHLGVVLLAMGEQIQGNAGLEAAAQAFRKALEVRRRDLAPLLWAQSANNLGAAAFALAKRTGDVALLNEAHACFEGAIEVYRHDGRAKTVQVIENNLMRVERLLMTRTGS